MMLTMDAYGRMDVPPHMYDAAREGNRRVCSASVLHRRIGLGQGDSLLSVDRQCESSMLVGTKKSLSLQVLLI